MAGENKAGQTDLPRFEAGDALSAAALNKIVSLLTKRIFGTSPIRVAAVSGGVAISYTPGSRRRGGGSGGTTVKFFRITTSFANGVYEGVEIDEPEREGFSTGNNEVNSGSGDPVLLYEDNRARGVPVGAYVRGTPGALMESGEAQYYFFSLPLGC